MELRLSGRIKAPPGSNLAGLRVEASFQRLESAPAMLAALETVEAKPAEITPATRGRARVRPVESETATPDAVRAPVAGHASAVVGSDGSWQLVLPSR
jgi:hypothetical protein